MVRTEGHRLLREWVKEHGRGAQADIARQVGRSEPAVSLWFDGSRPDGDARAALQRATGIPVEAWTEKPKKNGKRKAA